jgi:hypothetical protein
MIVHMMPIISVMRMDRIFSVVAVVDAEHPFYAANGAADRSADDGTDWPCDAVSFMEAMSSPSGNALSLYGYRHSKRCKTRNSN